MSLFHNLKLYNPDNSEAWDLLTGEITSPHGLRGEANVYPHTDYPERFTEFKEIGLRRNDQWLGVIRVISARVTGRRVVIKFDGIDSIDVIEQLRGVQLLIPKSWAAPLEEGEYYYHQLMGMNVVTTEGEALGQITDIWPTGANDVYETPLALIPAVHDIIREIDVLQGRMLVEARPGLKKSDKGL